MNVELKSAEWKDQIFDVFQDHDIKQVFHVPDAGHSRLIELCQKSNSIRTLALTTEVASGTLTGQVGNHDWNQACSGTTVFALSQGGTTLWQSDPISPYVDAVPFSVAVNAGTVLLSTTVSGNCAAAAWVGLEQ